MIKKFDICIIGLGPVGMISGLCFAKQGFHVIGLDKDNTRIAAFMRGQVPFKEPGSTELLREMQAAGRFHVTSNALEAIQSSRIIMICVGTPMPDGANAPDLSALEAVAETIGKAIAKGSIPKSQDLGISAQGAAQSEGDGGNTPPCTECKKYIIIVRSTVPPGTLRQRIAPVIERHSALKAGMDFHLVANPEFLREGTAIADFFDTGRIVIGADDEKAAPAVAELYREVKGERIFTTIETAEFAKYVDNSWHALKVAFANEMGRMVTAFGGDVEETARIFLADKKLNISEKYLQPGAAFGGSCLPKDVRGLNYLAEQYGVKLPVIAAILPSNGAQIAEAIAAILATGANKVGLLGIAFKQGVDDVRESPALAIAMKLQARGITVYGHDLCLQMNAELPIPLMALKEITAQAELLVKFHRNPRYDGLDALDFTKAIPQAAMIQTEHTSR